MNRMLPLCFALLAVPAQMTADVQLSFYGGLQSAQPSDVQISGDDVLADDDFSVTWQGRSFDAPPYYGIRATRWQTPSFGYGLDFAHNKVYPDDGSLPAGYDVLEMTDGLNTLTINAYRRWADAVGDITPYVGGGIGIAMPHVEVKNGSSETFGYQLTGPAATWVAGASIPFADRWEVFGEYKGTFSSNTADLESGGTLQTDITTNALNLGVSFNF